MKYGLVVYKETDNVGDDILTYSAKRFLPHIDYIIDRENLDTFFPNEKEFVSVIMNGWYLFNKFNWPPSPYIKPKFIGIHFSDNDLYGIKDEYLDHVGKEYLSHYAPVGCRDNSSLAKMRERGIISYFSGCLTLTLSKFDHVEKNNKVILVDVPEIVKGKIYSELNEQNVECISHFIPREKRGIDWEIRLKQVEDILKKYQGAKFVVTTRLHCALPCLALGTPVLFLYKESQDFTSRKKDFLEFLNSASVEEFMNTGIYSYLELQNRELHLELRDDLIKECNIFVEQCENEKVDLGELPEIDSFKRIYKSKIEWQKNLTDGEFVWLEKKHYDALLIAKEWLSEQFDLKERRIVELQKHIESLLEAKQWLEFQDSQKNERIKELENWCQELETGKKWIEEQWCNCQKEGKRT